MSQQRARPKGLDQDAESINKLNSECRKRVSDLSSLSYSWGGARVLPRPALLGLVRKQ
jgi:hypothetical protein